MRTLKAMETRTLARPMVLLLSHGYAHGYAQRQAEALHAPPPAAADDFGRPERFVPQRVRAQRRLVACAVSGAAAVIAAAWYLLL